MNVAGKLSMRGKLLIDEPMSKHTSWRLGGPADRYYVPADLQDLQDFLASIDTDVEILWVGLGSNLLVRDGGFRGQVIAPLNALRQIHIQLDGSLYAECGISCAKLAKFCRRKELAGADFFAGIPGTVGGALAMNAGAFGGETWASVEQLIMIDRQGRLSQREPSEFKVGYRQVELPQFPGPPRRRGVEYSRVVAATQCDTADRATLLRLGVQESARAPCRTVDRGGWSQGLSPRYGERIGQARQFYHQWCRHQLRRYRSPHRSPA